MANQNFKVKKGLEVGTGTTVSVDGINVTGVITATTFAGDGSALTGVTASGTGVVVQEEGSNIGTAATINFIGSNVTAALSGGIANVTVSGGSGGLSNVVEDTTPQLGGNLDLNSKNITGTGNISITGGFNATGVSTFQENVNFTSTASFGDNDKINVGTGNDLQIFHDGTSNIISDAVGAGISLVGNTKVVGVLTATSFSGSLATTDLTGTITNAQLAGSIADGKLASTFLKNVVEDTTPQLGGNLDANSKDIIGVANLNVAGISTFSIDSSSKSVQFKNTGDTARVVINMANAHTPRIQFISSDNDIAFLSGDMNANVILAAGNTLNLRANTSEAVLQADGNTTIFAHNVGITTVNTGGVTITGICTATSFSGSGSALTGLTGASVGTYGASTNTPIITVDSNGRITGIATVATSGAGGGGGISNIVEDTTPQLGGNLDLNSKSITGTGNIEITGYAGVSGVSTFSGAVGFATHIHDAGTGNLDIRSNLLRIKNDAGSETLATFAEDGAVSLYHDNALRLATTNTGVSITDNLNVAGISTIPSISGLTTFAESAMVKGNIYLNGPSNQSDLYIGSSNQVKLDHNGSSAMWSNTVGYNYIRTAGGIVVQKEGGGYDNIIRGIVDGAVELYYDNSKKLETTNTGVTVTGTLAATAVTGDGSGLTGVPGISTASSNIQVNFDVTANGSGAYRFTGPGNDAADDNPDLYLIRGQRYRFTNNSGGSHPFQIRSAAGGSAYSTGVTNNGGASGNIDFNVQHDAPARLYYQCTSHSAMVGNIYITGGANWQTTSVNTSTAEEIFTLNNVGIGTNNPVGNLEVRDSKANLIVAKDGLTVKSNSNLHTSYDMLQIGAGGALASYSTATATADTQLVHNAYRHSGGTFKYRYADTAMRIMMNSPGGSFRFQNAASGSADADITFTERLRIDSSGNIGIGTDTFTATSSGRQIVEIEGASGSLINFAVGGARKAYHFTDGTDVYSYNTVSGSYIIGTNDTERLRITSGGNFGIGNDGNFPIYTGTNDRTLILGTGSEDSAIQIHSGTSNYGGLYFGDATSGSNRYRGYVEFKHGTSDDFLRFGTAATERLRIDSSGHLIHTGLRSGGGDNKLAILSTLSHNTNEEKVAVYISENESSSNQLTFGGGSSSYNAVTTLRFMTASAVDTTTGTERLRITSDGHTLFSGLTSNIDTRNVKGISVQSPGGITFKRTGSTGSRNWRLRPDDLSAWGSLEFSVAPTDGSSDIPDAASDVVLELKSNKDVKIHDGNLVIGTSGHGIDFSASGNTGGMQSELLDDYEEGVWTPTLIGSSSNPSVSFSTQGGAYEKIGALVHASFFMAVSGVSSQGSGQLRIGGLPFNSSSNINAAEVPAVLLQSEPFTDGDGSNRAQLARTATNTNYLMCAYRELTTGNVPVPTNAAANVGTGYFIGHITYRTLS